MWNKPGTSHTDEQWEQLVAAGYMHQLYYCARISMGRGPAVATKFVRFECDGGVAWVIVSITEEYKDNDVEAAVDHAVDFMDAYSGDSREWAHYLTTVI